MKTFILHFGTKRSIIVLKYRKGVNQIKKNMKKKCFKIWAQIFDLMAPVPKIWPKFILPKKGQRFGLEMGQNSKKNHEIKKVPIYL